MAPAPCPRPSPACIRPAMTRAMRAAGKRVSERVLRRATLRLTRAQTALRWYQLLKRHQRRNVGRGGCSLACPAAIAAPTSIAMRHIARLAKLPIDVLRHIRNDSLYKFEGCAATIATRDKK